MAIEQRRHLYEILIRLDEDGYKGSHAIEMEQLVEVETGEVKASVPLPARPIALTDAADLLGEHLAELLDMVETLKAENTVLKVAAEKLEAARAAVA